MSDFSSHMICCLRAQLFMESSKENSILIEEGLLETCRLGRIIQNNTNAGNIRSDFCISHEQYSFVTAIIECQEVLICTWDFG